MKPEKLLLYRDGIMGIIIISKPAKPLTHCGMRHCGGCFFKGVDAHRKTLNGNDRWVGGYPWSTVTHGQRI